MTPEYLRSLDPPSRQGRETAIALAIGVPVGIGIGWACGENLSLAVAAAVIGAALLRIAWWTICGLLGR